MTLTLQPPIAPMEAQTAEVLPAGDWQYELKWDGFRCLAFRDGDDIRLQSKNARPLERYFPDVVLSLARLRARRFVLDGELVVPVADGVSFEALQLRLHPAASRVAKLAAEQPAGYVLFDLLVDDRGVVRAGEPLQQRRRRLERLAARALPPDSTVMLSPATSDVVLARRWLDMPRPGLDGVMAKRLDEPYRPGERTAMVKVKRERTVDCVVGGFRSAPRGPCVASLLLGLYDEEGVLHHVGHTSGVPERERDTLTRDLLARARPPEEGGGFDGRAPGGPSRWSRAGTRGVQPVLPGLVVEVAYDHWSGGRFRHGARLLRRRPEKSPAQCTFEQIPSGLLR